jgi:hypothetical protein
MLEGRHYDSLTQAYETGKLSRQQLSVVLANAGIGADFDPAPLPHRGANDRLETPDAPGLHVFPTPVGLSLTPNLTMHGELSQPLERVITEDLAAVRNAIPNGLSRRHELAYSTFHSALAVTNPEIKYVIFVTAIEALIEDNRKKPKAIVEALTTLRTQIDTSGDFTEIQCELFSLLEEDEDESINSLGAELGSQLSGTYAGRDPASFFKHVYNTRSRILHGAFEFTGNRKRPTTQEIKDANAELQRFALDLLTVESMKTKTQGTPRGE